MVAAHMRSPRFVRYLLARPPRWRMVASLLAVVFGVGLLVVALFSPRAGTARFFLRNDGARLTASANIFPGERLEIVDFRAVLTYPPSTNLKRSVILTVMLKSVFRDSTAPVQEQLAILYANGWAVDAELDLAGAEYDPRPRDMRSGNASWSIRAKDTGEFQGLVRLVLNPPAYDASEPQLSEVKFAGRSDARFQMTVEDAPITLSDALRVVLALLGSFATLPGLWLLFREYRAFRRELRQEAESRKPLIITP